MARVLLSSVNDTAKVAYGLFGEVFFALCCNCFESCLDLQQ